MVEAREHVERYSWWINELESLGLSIKKTNEFNDLKEMCSLTQIIKQTIYLDYKGGTNNLRHQINIV
ncbi:MAG TPA: hypothetical protein VEH06_04435 [Candidatus Bathyarchaeia archaeon]|nr:hypothetical protein [Candidatus Bathyarchaeia archaeon]